MNAYEVYECMSHEHFECITCSTSMSLHETKSSAI